MRIILLPVFLTLYFLAHGQTTLNDGALRALMELNHENKSSRLVISIKDSVIADRTFRGKPDELYRIYSITKLFSGIVVGAMIEQKLISSPEEKIAQYFDEWKNDPLKSQITIRHILQHNSGLFSTSGSRDIYPQEDFVMFAIQDSVITALGKVFFYNNRAINIISGVVYKVSGLSLEDYIRIHVFGPLGIQNYLWPSDKAGNSWGMDGLRLSAGDLLKIGQLLSNYGSWNGRQILSKEWCRMAFQFPLNYYAEQTAGYGMGLRVLYIDGGRFFIPRSAVDALREKGLDIHLTEKLYRISDTIFPQRTAFGKALKLNFSAEELEEINSFSYRHLLPVFIDPGNNLIVFHSGEIGQHLVIYPEKKVVLVRFINEKWGRKVNEEGRYRYELNGEMLPYMVKLAASGEANR